MKKLIILILIILTTSCSWKCNNRSITELQWKEIADELPDYPRLNKLSPEDKVKMQLIPKPIKKYLIEVIQFTKTFKKITND